jgi:squalene/oxidosqualene cyclase-like protein
MRALDDAVEHLLSLQRPEGQWEGEMVWNTMLLAQYVMTSRMVGRWPLPDRDLAGIRRHFEVTRRADGSWPAHSAGSGSTFVTVLAYVALRIAGVPAEALGSTREWMHAQPGGVAAIPSWGRMWLALLGLYDYSGINPVPPEAFLLPRWAPVHPDRFYVHTRLIYTDLSYLYGRRVRFDLGRLGGELRCELYDTPYKTVDFAAARGLTSSEAAVPPGRVLRWAHDLLARYERHPPRALRDRALRHCVVRVQRELAASAGRGVSPVSALLGCLVLADVGLPRNEVHEALGRLDAWRWEDASEGLRIVGARSSSWDTAFAMRALLCAPRTPQAVTALGRAYRWLAGEQQLDELPAMLRDGRDTVKGGWCFSDGAHRWPVSDCTAEALSAILIVHRDPDLRSSMGALIPRERLFDAVDFVLSRQNADGGFGTYERTRAPAAIERLNPSEMYADCMTDLSQPEPTASCVGALARFREAHPGYRRARVEAAIRRGVRHLRSRQRHDGSYPGSWGINFTYAACFVVDALLAAGIPPSDPAIARAVAWLGGTQKDDGGWGEHYTSCLSGRYVEHPESQAAMTAWALLTLVSAVGPADPAVRKAAHCLSGLQRRGSGGGWPQQAPSGIFFRTAVLDYRLYREVFPTWALARYAGADAASRTERTFSEPPACT